jgi:hypothetical protein
MKTEGALKPCGGSHGRGRADSGQLFADFLIRPTLSSALQYIHTTRPYPGQLLSAHIGLITFSRPMPVHLTESRLLTSPIWSTRSYLAQPCDTTKYPEEAPALSIWHCLGFSGIYRSNAAREDKYMSNAQTKAMLYGSQVPASSDAIYAKPSIRRWQLRTRFCQL